MLTATAPTWVVYSVPLDGSPRAVCTQAEWGAIDRARPGHFTLVRAGLKTEAEAERLARGSAGAGRPETCFVGRFGRVPDEGDEAEADEGLL